MTEEQNLEKQEKCNCICKSKGFRKFVVVALGTFVGVYCALSLFAAIHRPPMPPCMMCPRMMYPQIEYRMDFNGGHQNLDKGIPPFHKIKKMTHEGQLPQAQQP